MGSQAIRQGEGVSADPKPRAFATLAEAMRAIVEHEEAKQQLAQPMSGAAASGRVCLQPVEKLFRRWFQPVIFAVGATAANAVPVERRSVFLERTAAMLRMRGYGHFTDSDVTDVAKLARTDWRINRRRCSDEPVSTRSAAW
jgi:hypothetical protein